MRMIIKISLLAMGAYAGVAGVMYLFQRSMMYHPNAYLPSPAEAGVPELDEVRLRTEDGLELLAWYKPATSAGAVEIIYFHGNAGNIAHRAQKTRGLTEAGHGLLLVSYRGFGGNPGKPTEAGFFADARAAHAFLAARGVAGARIAVIGESLGSGVAVYLASTAKVGALMLEAPFTSTGDVGQRAYPIFPVKLLIKDRYDSLSRIGKVTVPVQIVHGEDDRVVPVELGKELFQAANQPKQGVFLAGANHHDLEIHGVTELQLEFLARHLGG